MTYPSRSVLVAALSAHTHYYHMDLFEIEQNYGSFEELYTLYANDSLAITADLRRELRVAWQSTALARMEQQLRHHAIKTYFYDEVGYPELFTSLIDKPYLIYVHGHIQVANRICLSCVGTRRLSHYGRQAVARILKDVGHYPITLVSGMAIGIDAEVHKAALRAGIPTIAVLGGGLDFYEPQSNALLGQEIVQNGCVISEYPPGVRPWRSHFLERNRLIAGLSRSTIVVEGKTVSGSLVTAKFALTYGREVGAVPGDIFATGSEAPLLLLRDGAWPIVSPQDVCGILGLPPVRPKNRPPHNQVHALLRTGLHTFDALQQKLAISFTELQRQITFLELEGVIGMNRIGEYYVLRE